MGMILFSQEKKPEDFESINDNVDQFKKIKVSFSIQDIEVKLEAFVTSAFKVEVAQ